MTGTVTPSGAPALTHPELDGIGLTTAYQPIVDLGSGAVLAHEALVRGPAAGLSRPDLLFAAARAEGRLVEFDRLCRRLALDTALSVDASTPRTLFLNVEPAGIPGKDAPGEAQRYMRRGGRIVLEFTERALTADPARVQSFATRLRRQGVAIALDDVGSHPGSLALMPFLRPEVVKLDMRLVQNPLDDETAGVVAAAAAYAQQNGATLLAEGIETPEHERRARGLGATLGQGYLYGRPGPLVADPRSRRSPGPMFASRSAHRPDRRSPVDIVAGRCPLRRGGTDEVLVATELIERRALTAEGPIVMIGSAPHVVDAENHARRWTEAARHAALVALLNLGPSPLPGVRGTDLAHDDPLRRDAALVVVGPHVAKALVARPVGDDRYDYTVVYDRALVLEAAESLMSRIVPVHEPAPVLDPPLP